MRHPSLPLAAACAVFTLAACGGGSSTASPVLSPPSSVSPPSADSTAQVSPSPAASPSAAPAVDLAGKDAAAVINWLKAQGVPVSVTTVYDEATDPNNQLGRPGGYTSKAVFQDARVPADEYDETDMTDTDRGGSVEVFGDEAAAVARSKEIQGKLKSFGLGSEYDYIVGGVLVRVSGTVLPSQAADYAKALGVQAQPA